MKNIVIIGAGTAGTIMANKLWKALDRKEWKITILDHVEDHYYQPGFLFIPFGIYDKKDVVKAKKYFLPGGVQKEFAEVDRIDAVGNHVILMNGGTLPYDYLIIASGAEVNPDQTPGLKEELWNKIIFEFYTADGAMALRDFFKTWEGGKLVMAVADMPIKCPVAPLEFVFMSDWFFTKTGIRNKVDITYVTPLPDAFTKPEATKMLSKLMVEKNIKIVPEFYIERVDNKNRKLVSYDGREVPFDALTIVPVNMGSQAIARSGLGDDLNFVPTDPHTLKAKNHDNIYVIGDASDLPTSKAGSVAHFASDILFKNIMSAIKGLPPTASFDGHANCFIETGYQSGIMIDFNYTTEPVTGTYPIPGVGPFRLLQNSRFNHYGKLFFRWIYWNLLLKARPMFLPSKMTLTGKKLHNRDSFFKGFPLLRILMKEKKLTVWKKRYMPENPLT